MDEIGQINASYSQKLNGNSVIPDGTTCYATRYTAPSYARPVDYYNVTIGIYRNLDSASGL